MGVERRTDKLDIGLNKMSYGVGTRIYDSMDTFPSFMSDFITFWIRYTRPSLVVSRPVLQSIPSQIVVFLYEDTTCLLVKLFVGSSITTR